MFSLTSHNVVVHNSAHICGRWHIRLPHSFPRCNFPHLNEGCHQCPVEFVGPGEASGKITRSLCLTLAGKRMQVSCWGGKKKKAN